MWILSGVNILRLFTDDFTLILHNGGQAWFMFMSSVARIAHGGSIVVTTDTRMRNVLYWHSDVGRAGCVGISDEIYYAVHRVINRTEIYEYSPISLISQVDIMNLLSSVLY